MKKVALIGAWGYGNVGDDAYPRVWRRYFPGVEFSLYNSDLPCKAPEADLYLFGGGGILFDNGTAHYDYLSTYAEWARQRGIPIAFVSVGVQLRINFPDYTAHYIAEALGRWATLLGAADLVTVRDRESQSMLAERGIHAEQYPDLCYLTGGLEQRSEKFLTVLPGTGLTTAFSSAREQLEECMRTYPGKPLIIMNMGSPATDSLVDDFASNYPVLATFKSQHTPVELALNVIRNSCFVLTGRYHGLVFSRAAGKPFWTPSAMQTFKLSAEDRAANMTDALGHMRAVANLLGEVPRCDLPANLLSS